MHDEEELVVDVLGEQLGELLLPLRVLCLSHLALVVLYQVHDVVPDVHWRVDEGALLVQRVVVAEDEVRLVQAEDLEAVGQHLLVVDLGGAVEDLVQLHVIGELREVNLLVHQQSLLQDLILDLSLLCALLSSDVGATDFV